MLGNIFDVFSRRKRSDKESLKPISETFRQRFVMLVKDFTDNSFYDVLRELHKKLSYLHGKSVLSPNAYQGIGIEDDVYNYILQCDDAHLLDAIEYLFQTQSFKRSGDECVFIKHINEFFAVDDLPYYLTDTVWEEVDTYFYGSPAKARQVREFPKVIRKDSDVLHNTAVEPALALLRKPDLLNANEEFMLALDEYRKGKYRDSVTKCCSALESTMKVICARNKYKFSDKDTAGVLLKTIITSSNLDSFWEQPIMLIATIRNRLSYSHGAGLDDKNVPEHVAKYSINAVASAILLLCDEAY
ncbi:hypothetical protein ACI1IE_002112 [Vibrio vulnificus]